MKSELRAIRTTPSTLSLQNPNPLFNSTTAAPQGQASLDGCTQLGSLDGGCIEKLLLHCASALEENDVTLAQQVMWVLNNVASSTGDPNQRLAACFLRALISRAARVCPANAMSFNPSGLHPPRHHMSVTELAGYVDLIPWHRFGYCAANSAISKAVQGCPKVHVLDFSITHCMQWPTLIDALAKRPQGPPLLRLTVPSFRPQVPPLLNISCEEVCLRLANFAKFREVPFEFNVIGNGNTLSAYSSSDQDSFYSFDGFELLLSQLNPSSLNLQDDEALVVNLQNWLRYLPDHESLNPCSLRDTFLNVIKSLNPKVVIVVDEDSDLNAPPSLTSRTAACFNYLWIPFDALDTFLSKDSRQRVEYESDISQKIENIIAFEGPRRIERPESGAMLSQRMRDAGFSSGTFTDDTAMEVKGLLDEHASGWGMKREEDMLVLTWKGHNSVFATAWLPS